MIDFAVKSVQTSFILPILIGYAQMHLNADCVDTWWSTFIRVDKSAESIGTCRQVQCKSVTLQFSALSVKSVIGFFGHRVKSAMRITVPAFSTRFQCDFDKYKIASGSVIDYKWYTYGVIVYTMTHSNQIAVSISVYSIIRTICRDATCSCTCTRLTRSLKQVEFAFAFVFSKLLPHDKSLTQCSLHTCTCTIRQQRGTHWI